MEEKKNKVAEFWEENKENIKKECTKILYTTIGVGVGYFIGRKAMEAQFIAGLGACIGANPNIETEFLKAKEIIDERTK